MRSIHLYLATGLFLLILGGVWLWVDGNEDPSAYASHGLPVERDEGSSARLSAEEERELGAREERLQEQPRESLLAESERETQAPNAAEGNESLGVWGRVLDAAGEPVSGARVIAATGFFWVLWPLDMEPFSSELGQVDSVETLTDEHGRYNFEQLTMGRLRMVVRARGFAPRRVDDWHLPKARPHQLEDLLLEPGATLAGQVVDARKQPVAGARILSKIDQGRQSVNVSMPGRGIPLTETGADGSFLIDELEAGPWALIVDSPAHLAREEQGRTEPGSASEGLVIVLETGADIHGKVTGAEPEQLARLRVSARSKRGQGAAVLPPGLEGTLVERARHAGCDGEGNFVLGGLVHGVQYRLTLWEPQAEDASPLDPGAWSRLPLSGSTDAFAGERGVEVVVQERASLTLQVVDDESGNPLQEFLVYAGSRRPRLVKGRGGKALREHPQGKVVCNELGLGEDAGKVALRVRAEGYRDHVQAGIEVGVAQELDLGVVRLKPAPVIEVHVIDDATGDPVAGATVFATTQSGQYLQGVIGGREHRDPTNNADILALRTEADGRARLTLEPGKESQVQASADGYVGSAVVSVASAESGPLELRLGRGGRVVIRVVDTTGKPLVGVNVAHRGPNAAVQTRFSGRSRPATDRLGELTFEHLEPGPHGFQLSEFVDEAVAWSSSGGDPTQWVEVSVREGETESLELVTDARGGLVGLIREAGQPLADARLQLWVPERPEEWQQFMFSGEVDPKAGRTDADGRFEFEGVECGEYTLSIQHPTRRMPDFVEVIVLEEPQELNIDLSISVVEGRVTDQLGRPVPEAQVSVRVVDISKRGHVNRPGNLRITESEDGSPNFDMEQAHQDSTTTDDDGRYSLRGVSPSVEIVISVSGANIEDANSSPFKVPPDEVRQGVDFQLAIAGAIDVAIPKAPQNPGVWYRVVASLQSEDKSQRQTKEAYLFARRLTSTIEGLKPGRWELSIFRTGRGGNSQALDSQSVEVRGGERTSVMFPID